MPEPYLAPVVYDGEAFVMRASRVRLTRVETLRAAGHSAESMVEREPALRLDEVAAYLADDLAETESVAYARADVREYAERREPTIGAEWRPDDRTSPRNRRRPLAARR